MMTLPPGLGGGGSTPPEPTAASIKVIVGSGDAPLRPQARTEKVGVAAAASSGDVVIVETPGDRLGDLGEVELEAAGLKEMAQPLTHVRAQLLSNSHCDAGQMGEAVT